MTNFLSQREVDAPHVEFGSAEVEFLPASAIIDLQQIRQHYDAAELQELADRIPRDETDDGVKFQLINPPTIAVFTDIGAVRKYLDDHCRFYGLESGAHDDVLSSSDAMWLIRVNGHRRGHAIEMKCQELGIALDDAMVASTLLHNPNFDDARQKQYVENTSSPIKPAEDAVSFEREYMWRWGVHPSEPIDTATRRWRIRTIAEFTCFSTDKVKSGLLYVGMPEDIRGFTQNGLSYTNVVDLARLREAYASVRQGPDLKYDALEAEQRMRDFFETVILKRLIGQGKATVSAAIEGKIKEVSQTAAYVTDELFMIDEEAARKTGRKKVRKDIASAAILALQYADLTPADHEKILSIITSRIAEGMTEEVNQPAPLELFA